jgi:DNA-binding transcriptional LysR family regulator
MDIQSLRYAVTLAEERHFGRAARRHYITAQAFGRRVHRLEGELGVRLFERTSRRVAPTAAGERFVVVAQGTLARMDELADVAPACPAGTDPPHHGLRAVRPAAADRPWQACCHGEGG